MLVKRGISGVYHSVVRSTCKATSTSMGLGITIETMRSLCLTILGQVSVSRGLHHLTDGSYVYTQPKSAKSRSTIALTPSTVLLLKGHKMKQSFEHKILGIPLQDTDLIFNNVGKLLRPNSVSRAWKTLAKRCGIKVVNFHAGRHTHATLLLRQNVHPKIVQERMGHSTIVVTLDTYSYISPGLQEAVAQKFDDLLKLGHNYAVVKKELVAI